MYCQSAPQPMPPCSHSSGSPTPASCQLSSMPLTSMTIAPPAIVGDYQRLEDPTPVWFCRSATMERWVEPLRFAARQSPAALLHDRLEVLGHALFRLLEDLDDTAAVGERQ